MLNYNYFLDKMWRWSSYLLKIHLSRENLFGVHLSRVQLSGLICPEAYLFKAPYVGDPLVRDPIVLGLICLGPICPKPFKGHCWKFGKTVLTPILLRGTGTNWLFSRFFLI